MKWVYIVGAVVGVVAWLAIGLLIAQGPQPEIVVPAESIVKAGPLHITNTLITSWVVMVLLVGGSLLATRSMKLMPSGAQNFFEAVVAFLVGQVEDIAGEKNGRRFFMVVATIFLYIIANNWFGLLPFFNAIGKTEDVGHEIFAEIASPSPDKLKIADGAYTERKKFAGTKMDGSSSLLTITPGTKAIDFVVNSGDRPADVLDRYIVFLAHNFAGFKTPEIEEGKAYDAATVKAARDALEASALAPKLITENNGGDALTSPALGQQVYGIDFDKSKKFATIIPLFRGAFSDLNNTLALGLVAFVMIEFWGFQALGIGYLKKFFNFSSPINAFVGLLELLSEFIRVISFAFRLFGNIFAGEVLVLMLTFLMPFLFVDIIYGLELFVGFIQAAVFALLTLVFASMAVESHGEGEHHEGHAGEEGSADAHQNQGAAQAH